MRGGRGGETVAQVADEGGGRADERGGAAAVGAVRSPAAGGCAGGARVGGQSVEVQAAAGDEVGEDLGGGQGDLVAGLLQPYPEARVGVDVAAGPGGGDEDSHAVRALSALAWTAVRR
ncbi:hypothetical protein GCM10010218_41510 [Streptomyces mashuensis]|uniref:Uncharacterized protein n=1 Tax=Streptomyces mashuensis TaxID=33904 RepID=A0A919B5E3_9ACTN|nr:hypothetical protein GCM10010218_41510 [Streptomyces mashuensis]